MRTAVRFLSRRAILSARAVPATGRLTSGCQRTSVDGGLSPVTARRHGWSHGNGCLNDRQRRRFRKPRRDLGALLVVLATRLRLERSAYDCGFRAKEKSRETPTPRWREMDPNHWYREDKLPLGDGLSSHTWRFRFPNEFHLNVRSNATAHARRGPEASKATGLSVLRAG